MSWLVEMRDEPIKLACALFPGTTTAPESPPFSSDSRVIMFNPPRLRSAVAFQAAVNEQAAQFLLEQLSSFFHAPGMIGGNGGWGRITCWRSSR